MGMLETIETLKGKALDLAAIEMLKHSFQVQEENNGQLKELNATLKEKIQMQGERIGGLQQDLTTIKRELADRERELTALRKTVADRNPDEPQIDAERLAILEQLAKEESQVFGIPLYRDNRARCEFHLDYLTKIGFLKEMASFYGLTPTARDWLYRQGKI